MKQRSMPGFLGHTQDREEVLDTISVSAKSRMHLRYAVTGVLVSTPHGGGVLADEQDVDRDDARHGAARGRALRGGPGLPPRQRHDHRGLPGRASPKNTVSRTVYIVCAKVVLLKR